MGLLLGYTKPNQYDFHLQITVSYVYKLNIRVALLEWDLADVLILF